MKKKKWIGIGIVLVLVFVVIAAVINVNKRFPQRTKEVYAPGEWMPLDNSVSVCADTARILEGEELEACMRDEFGGQDFQVKKKKGRVRQLVIKFRIKNTGDSEINIWQYMLKLAVNSYPDGWTTGLGTHYAQENTLAAGEECECMAAYTIGLGMVSDSEYPRFVKNNTFQIVQAVYPVQRMIEFKIGEEGT